MENKRSQTQSRGLVAKVANTAAAMATAAAANYASRSEAGIIGVANLDKNGTYTGSEAYFGNFDGGAEGADPYDNPFSSTSPLEISSLEPGYKADNDAKPVDTFGWLFDLSSKDSLDNIQNYLRFQVTDSTNLPGLVAYDLTPGSTRHNLNVNTNGGLTEINLGTSVPAGEYAHWRVDIVPEPSTGLLATIGIGAAMAGAYLAKKFSRK